MNEIESLLESLKDILKQLESKGIKVEIKLYPKDLTQYFQSKE